MWGVWQHILFILKLDHIFIKWWHCVASNGKNIQNTYKDGLKIHATFTVEWALFFKPEKIQV